MGETIRQELQLRNLQAYLQESLKVRQSDKAFLQYMQHQPIRHSATIHRLNAIVLGNLYDQQFLFLLDRLNLYYKLQQFLNELHFNRLPQETQLSEYELISIFELIEVLLSMSRVNEQRIAKEVEASKSILNYLYAKIQNSANQQLLGAFVKCLYLLRKKKKDILKDIQFVQLFIKTLNRSDQFLEYFCDYIDNNITYKFQVLEILIRGLGLRLPTLILDDNYRALLLDTYTSLRNFLKKQPTDSVWFQELINQQNMIIFEVFKAMMTKNCYHSALALLMDEFVVLYLRANLVSYRKYEFILSFYKFVIQKAPTFFTLIATNILNDEVHFLQWFVSEELKKNQEVALNYMTNRFALEFLLILLICYLFFFPKKADQIGAKMRNLSLLDEVKYFMDYEPLQDYLRVFYHHTGEEQIYEDFINRIQDSTVIQQFR